MSLCTHSRVCRIEGCNGYCGPDLEEQDEPCTCTIACIPQGKMEDQVCKLTIDPEEAA